MTSVDMQKVSAGAYSVKQNWVSRQLSWLGYPDLDERPRVQMGSDLNNFTVSIPSTRRMYLRGTRRQQDAFISLFEQHTQPDQGTVLVSASVFSLSRVLRHMRTASHLTVLKFITHIVPSKLDYQGSTKHEALSILARANLVQFAYVRLSEIDANARASLGLSLMLHSGAHMALLSHDDIIGTGALGAALGREIKIAFCDINFIMTGSSSAPSWFTPEKEVLLI